MEIGGFDVGQIDDDLPKRSPDDSHQLQTALSQLDVFYGLRTLVCFVAKVGAGVAVFVAPGECLPPVARCPA